jgi:hypothetical protein
MIVVSELLWDRLLGLLIEPPGRVERVGFIDGFVGVDTAIATTVVVPDAALHAGYYDVSAAQMSQAGKHLRRNRLQRIAQAHTHEGAWVGHSRRDDELAYSHEDGAVSIVIPFHARERTHLLDCGIHLYRNGGWEQLARDESSDLIRIVPGTLNFRANVQLSAPGQAPATDRSWWKRIWRSGRKR